jgi:membrane-anchored protein YejM (alkaline phosphatase superfamily)
VLHNSSEKTRLLRWWGWLLLTTICVALCISSRYFAVAELDRAATSLAFRGVMLVAHFATFFAVLLLPTLIAILLRAPACVVIPLGLVCSTAALTGLLIDTQVYQLYRFHINAGVMNLLLGGAAPETFEFSRVMYAQAAALVAAIVAVESAAAALWWRYVQRTPGSRPIANGIAGALVATVVVFHSTHVWADVYAYGPILEQTDVLPLGYAATAKRSLRALGVHVRTRPSLHRTPAQDSNSLAYPLRPLSCQPEEALPNIIVILIDSWRHDALNARATPNLDAFSRRSARFMDHHSGGNATRIGVFSLFYSIPGTYWHRVLAERQGPVVISQLRSTATTFEHSAAPRCSARNSTARCSRRSRTYACARTAATRSSATGTSPTTSSSSSGRAPATSRSSPCCSTIRRTSSPFRPAAAPCSSRACLT